MLSYDCCLCYLFTVVVYATLRVVYATLRVVYTSFRFITILFSDFSFQGFL